LDLGGQQLPDGNPVLPELSPERLARFQAELAAFAQRYPDGPITIDLTDVDLTEVIRAQLVPNAGQLNDAADLVRAGKLPLGALAAASSRSYTTMLIEQSCGIQYAVNPAGDAFKREIEIAKQALNGEVVVEPSTLALVTLLPQRWPTLRSAFSSVRLPRLALTDIDNARSDLARAPGFSYSIGYDPTTDALVRTETSLAEHQRLHQRILKVEEAARQLVVTDSRQPSTPDLHQAWSSAISLAKEQGLPLWSDDIALRSIAADQGIPAFGTYALLATLTEAGLIADTLEKDTQALVDAQIIKLPSFGG
jgi:predicted nucleic acid-binding protein